MERGPGGSAAVPAGCHATTHLAECHWWRSESDCDTLLQEPPLCCHGLPRNNCTRHTKFEGTMKLFFLACSSFSLLGEVVAVVVVVVVVCTVSIMVKNNAGLF